MRVKMFILATSLWILWPNMASSAFSGQVPEGWRISHCENHEIVIDENRYQSPPKSYSIKSSSKVKENDVCSLYQNLNLSMYIAKRVQIKAYMRGSTNASIWAEVYKSKGSGKVESIMGASKALSMNSEVTEWIPKKIVLDIPNDATSFAFGFLMRKHGQVWIDDISVDIVNKNIPLDGVYTRFLKGPVNLP